MTNFHKVNTTGYRVRVEPMPPAPLLEVAPEDVREAVAALTEANEASREASRALTEARKSRRLAEVPSTFPALDDTVYAAEVEARARMDAGRAAGRALAAALEEHRKTIVRAASRRDLERFVEAVDALPALSAFLGGGRAGAGGPGRTDLAEHVDPVLQARPDVAAVGRALDETNIPALLERAGLTAEEVGLVPVVRTTGALVRILTTPSRAETLATSGAWRREDDKEEVA